MVRQFLSYFLFTLLLSHLLKIYFGQCQILALRIINTYRLCGWDRNSKLRNCMFVRNCWWKLTRGESYLTNRLNFSVCVYCNRSQMKYDTRRSRVAWLLFITRCDVFCDLLQYIHTEKCNLFVLYNKNSSGLFENFWGMKKEK